ncbi:hypothetical protein TCSYLVIO_005692 [Trypanosoma cruzi]|nr:hypothetical protein TCSYLVIO_005692 [Trypanosoma cruzi]
MAHIPGHQDGAKSLTGDPSPGNAGRHTAVQGSIARIVGEARRLQCFPHGMFVVCAGLAASTSVRTSRVLLEHSRGTTSCEDTWYCSADHRIYLGKNERRQQKHIRECCSKLARMLSPYFVTGQCDGAPCVCCLRSQRRVLKWSASFCEKSSVCQRDRGTWLAVAGVLSGTALECRAPRVGRSPRWGWRSGIVSRLLLNAVVVVVVDGKWLMREREIVCCRVISLSGTRWSDACVFAL